MRATSKSAVVVPDDEEGEEARREDAVDGEVRAEDGVPVLDSAAGADGGLPSDHEDASGRLPGWGELGDEIIAAWAEDGAALPGPGDEGNASRAEDDGGIVL